MKIFALAAALFTATFAGDVIACDSPSCADLRLPTVECDRPDCNPRVPQLFCDSPSCNSRLPQSDCNLPDCN